MLEAEVAAGRLVALVAAAVALVFAVAGAVAVSVVGPVALVLVAVGVAVSGLAAFAAWRVSVARRQLARRDEGRYRGLRRSRPVSATGRLGRIRGVLGYASGILGALKRIYGAFSESVDRRIGRIRGGRPGRGPSRVAGSSGPVGASRSSVRRCSRRGRGSKRGCLRGPESPGPESSGVGPVGLAETGYQQGPP